MKKTSIKSNSLWLLTMLLLLSIFTATASTLEYEKKKEFNKSFNVSLSDLLQVDNRYGNITITHWNKNEVAIRVVIEVAAASEQRAQENLDRISISLEKVGNTITAITTLKPQQDYSSNGRSQRFTINYFINMPSKLSSDLSLKYGNINLPEENNGKCVLNIKYGNLNAGNFNAPLKMEAKYSNVDLGNIQNATMDLGYVGNFTCKDAKNLEIDSKYSNLTLRHVEKLVLSKKYGNVKINNADEASIDMKYSEGVITTLKKSLNMASLDYGSLTVKELSPSFSEVRVDARYGTLKLGIPASAAFQVEAERMKYGNYDVDGFKVTNSSKNDKENYRAEINGGGSRKIYFEGNNYSNLTIKAL